MKPDFSLNALGPDGGPMYRETDLARLVAEPWNGLSAALFLVLSIYWLYRLRGEWRRYGFLVGCLAVLAVGGVGGALFHTFRVSRVFYLMDVLPIGLLTLAISIYLWLHLLPARWMVPAIVAPFVVGQRLLFLWLPHQDAISAAYAITAVLVLSPIALLLRRTGGRYAGDVARAVGLFTAALVFRILDPYPLPVLTNGTHWLWHTGSAAAVFFFIRYLHRILADGLPSPDRIPSQAS